MPTTSEIRLGQLLGLPVILEGRMVGRIERAVITPDGECLRGVMLRRGLGGAKWASRDHIEVLGEVSVILKHPPTRVPKDADFAFHGVRDTGGMALGWVTDAYLHTGSFRLTALEVSLGLMEELRGGRYLARKWSVTPETGEVLIPCGCALEKRQQLPARR